MPTEAPPDADAVLMQRLASGEDRALNELMERWRDKVGAFIYRMTHDHAVTVDLTQETFVRLYQSRLRYRPGALFSTYLFTIAANLVRNHARWRQRHPSVSIEAGEETGHEAADQAPSPDESAASHDKLRAIQVAMAALPPELREAMTLFTHEDLGYAEIATIAGCSPKAVETRIYRARQLLKEALKDLER